MAERPRTLTVGDGLSLPIELVTQKNAILAMSGAGKSNTAVVLAEEMTACGVPWIAIDPKGDWWGVRSSRDGKGAGLKVPIFGGEHGDLGLSPQSGQRMAELVAAGRVTGVFDISEFDTLADRVRFLTDFASTLLERQRTPIHIFCEECEDYLPQSAGKLNPLQAQCVGAWKRLAKRGRFRGIGITLVSQRAAAVNKDALNQCDTLIAMRVTWPRDRDAVKDVLGQHEKAPAVLKSLPTLEDGEAWIWSPQRLKVMERVRFRRRATFDSGRTPEIGQALVVPQLADIDLDALRTELDAEPEPTVEALKARIAELEEARGVPLETEDPGDTESLFALRDAIDQHLGWRNQDEEEGGDYLARIVQVGEELRLQGARLERMESLAERLHETGCSVVETARDLIQALPTGGPIPQRRTEVVRSESPAAKNKPNAADDFSPDRPVVARSDTKVSGPKPNAGLSRCPRLILKALVQHGRLSLTQAALIAGYATDSGGVRNAAGELRSLGYAEGSNASLAATASGRAALGRVERLPTGSALAEYWYGKLSKAEREILRQVLRGYPDPLSLHTAAMRAGYAPDSGGVRNAAGRLRTLSLVHGGNAAMTADARLVDA